MVLSLLAAIVVPPVLYLGPGFLLSRFIHSTQKNNPLFWIFLGLVVTPLVIVILGVFLQVEAWHILLLALLCLGLGFFVPSTAPSFLSLFTVHRNLSKKEQFFTIFLLSLFFTILLIPKLSLVVSDRPSVGDDLWRVRYVLSLAFDLSSPRHFHLPSAPFSYYTHDYFLPAVLFRLTPFSLGTSWFLHNMLEYAAFLWIFCAIARECFRTAQGRVSFILALTFLSGFDYFVYRFLGIQPSSHLEWWSQDLPLAQGFGFQISSFYTLFLWVPSHLEAGIFALLIIFLLRANNGLAHRIAIAILFAAMLRCSTFVFIPAAFAVALWELWSWRTEIHWRKRIGFIGLQALIFIALSLSFIFSVMGRSGDLYRYYFILPFFPVTRLPSPFILSFVVNVAKQCVNILLTFPFVLSIDLGIVFFGGVWYFFSSKDQEHGEPFPRSLLVIFLISTFLVLFFFASPSTNDLFMRGIISAQFVFAIAFASIVDRVRIQRFAWIPLSILLLLQTTNAFFEFAHRSDYRAKSVGLMFSYIRTSIPKNAIFFTDDPELCHELTTYGNRVCMNNVSEMGLQEEIVLGKPPPSFPKINQHSLEAVFAYAEDHQRYLLARNPIQHPKVKFLRMDEGLNLYEVLP